MKKTGSANQINQFQKNHLKISSPENSGKKQKKTFIPWYQQDMAKHSVNEKALATEPLIFSGVIYSFPTNIDLQPVTYESRGGCLAPHKWQIASFFGIFRLQEVQRLTWGKRLNSAISITKPPVSTGTGAVVNVLS